MKPCTILDLGRLDEVLTAYHGSSAIVRIHQDLLTGRGIYFLENDYCMVYEPMSTHKYQAHIYCVSRDSRGKALANFAMETGRWMRDNREATCIINFVYKDRLDLRFFMRMIGAKRMGEIPGSNQIMYVTTEENVRWQ